MVLFYLGLRLQISGRLHDLLIHYDIAPAQFMPNTWRTLMVLIILVEKIDLDLSYEDIVNLCTLLKHGKDFGR